MPTCEYCNRSFSERGIGTHKRYCKARTEIVKEEGKDLVQRDGLIVRKAELSRETNETNINLILNIDGKGNAKIDTGIGFFDHMLEAFATHGLFDLSVQAIGDINVDCHHTIEDVGIVLGLSLIHI